MCRYEEKSCCLPRGGPPTTSSPPKGHDCPPASHYWSSSLGCCVPRNPPPPDQPPPQCRNGWEWYPALQMCLPEPSKPAPPPSYPSGGQHTGWKRSYNKSRSVALCPYGLDACPISGLTKDFECIDTAAELESCGGCVSLGQGHDCTAIPGVWNVGCEQGHCAGTFLLFKTLDRRRTILIQQ